MWKLSKQDCCKLNSGCAWVFVHSSRGLDIFVPTFILCGSYFGKRTKFRPRKILWALYYSVCAWFLNSSWTPSLKQRLGWILWALYCSVCAWFLNSSWTPSLKQRLGWKRSHKMLTQFGINPGPTRAKRGTILGEGSEEDLGRGLDARRDCKWNNFQVCVCVFDNGTKSVECVPNFQQKRSPMRYKFWDARQYSIVRTNCSWSPFRKPHCR